MHPAPLGLSHTVRLSWSGLLTYGGMCVCVWGACGDEEGLMCFDMGRTLKKDKGRSLVQSHQAAAKL